MRSIAAVRLEKRSFDFSFPGVKSAGVVIRASPSHAVPTAVRVRPDTDCGAGQCPAQIDPVGHLDRSKCRNIAEYSPEFGKT